MRFEGQIVDIIGREIFPGSIEVTEGKIVAVNRHETTEKQFIMPGFVDAHDHIESSMLAPREFARYALKQGTIAIVTDPHEIGNVCGREGIRFMMDEADKSPLKACFAVSSCIPATPLCTSGAVIDAKIVAELLEDPRTYALAEMMDFPGIIHDDPECMAKVSAAHNAHKPIDGHAPLLTGDDLKKYVAAGISTDHEASNLEEAEEKIALGMKILIREGSTARNFNALHPLIAKHKDHLMFCTDDMKAIDLLDGHINRIVSKAVKLGYNLFDVLQIACVNPVHHYHIPMGLLQVGDAADFIICNDLTEFRPKATYVDGELASELPYAAAHKTINQFRLPSITLEQLADDISQKDELHVIQAIDGELITPHIIVKKKDFDTIQKIVVINRYQEEPSIGIGYIKGFDLKGGAVAQTIAHDSHHIIATGSSDELIYQAISELIQLQGGIVVVDEQKTTSLAFPLGGLMANSTCDFVAHKQHELIQHLKALNCPLASPIVALGFMQLVVIPELKITDRGLFDVNEFRYIG